MQLSTRGIRISVSNIGFLCLFGIVTAQLGMSPAVAAGTITSTTSTPGTPDTPVADRVGEIRVLIFDHMQPREIELTNPQSGLLVFIGESNSPAYQFSPSESLVLTIDGRHVRLRNQNNDIRGDMLRVSAPEGETFSIRTRNAPDTRQYYGQLEVRVRSDGKGFDMVNRVPIEAYVAAVLGSEYGLKDLEGSKAMAVAARTYALYAMQNGSGPYHLVDNERAQVYRGATAATPLTWEATRATLGEVLTYNGKPIEAVYSSSNGGHSADNESIWSSTPLPYLRGRKDPFDSVSPDASWRFDIDQNRLNKELSRRFGLDVKDIRIERPASDGRVRTVSLVAGNGREVEISGSRFRSVVATNHGNRSLKSTFFKIRKSGNKYRFDGHGYGHGVGLSQWGAHGMALQGRDYTDILDFYYPGTRVEMGFEGSFGSDEVTLPVIASVSTSENDETIAREPTVSSTPRVASVSGWGQKRSLKVNDDSSSSDQLESSSGSREKKSRRIGW